MEWERLISDTRALVARATGERQRSQEVLAVSLVLGLRLDLTRRRIAAQRRRSWQIVGWPPAARAARAS